MSFVPFSSNANNINESLIGVGIQPKILDDNDLLYSKRLHGPVRDNQTHLVLVIVLSAILFVTIVATYDLIKAGINYGFSSASLHDAHSHNTQEDIDRTLTADYYALLAIITFFAVAVVIALITIPILLKYIKND